MLHIKLLLAITLFLFINIWECCGYRILGIFPLNSKSHQIMFEQLMKGLAKRGHQVDVVSTFPMKKPYPNYTEIIIPSSLPTLVNNMDYKRIQKITTNSMMPFIAKSGGTDICDAGLKYPEIQNLIKNPPKNPPYDLYITEVSSAHCFMAFGPYLKVPMIGLSSAVLYPWGHDFIANPENLAFIPNTLLEYMEDMNFWNRLYNVIHNTYIKMYFNYATSSQSEMIKNYIGRDMPNVRESERNLSLILVNSHISLNGVKPTTPALVEVGGLHIQDDDTDIPAEYKVWLNESKDGFIYFTFGSMVTIESFPKHIIEIFYKSFKKISPTRVLMKVPRPELLPFGLPDNVRTFVWMSQLKVLKHENIRGFITHGGLLSTQEAIYSAVPMIGMPLFADQFLNIDLYVKKKVAIRLNYLELTESKLDETLHEILHNPIYRETSKAISKRFLDRLINPMDEACYWIEYIGRHGSDALKSPAVNFSWWQIALLDIYLTLLIASVVIIIVIYYLIKYLIDIINENLSETFHLKQN